MENVNRKWGYLILILVLFIVNSCSKEEGDNTSKTITDKDGNVYETVTIGTQVWMKENLKTTKYRNGDPIGTTTPATKNIATEWSQSPKYQWAYGGSEGNADIYGRLYTWFVVNDSRNVCPIGWHVPTDAEWTTLTAFLGGEDVAGGKLKETGFTHWQSPNTGATNNSGFNAVPGGIRNQDGRFAGIGEYGLWWSSTQEVNDQDDYHAFYRVIHRDQAVVERTWDIKTYAFSVRCLKD